MVVHPAAPARALTILAAPHPIVADTAQTAAGPPAEQLLRGRRILLAEGDPETRHQYHVILSRAGAEVTTVADGAAAVRTCQMAHGVGTPYDLVVLDFKLATLDGAKVTASLRAAGFRGPIAGLTRGIDDRQGKAWRDSGVAVVIPTRLSESAVVRRIAAIGRAELPPESAPAPPARPPRDVPAAPPATSVFEGVSAEDLAPVPAALFIEIARLARNAAWMPIHDRRRSPRRFMPAEILVRPIDDEFRPAGEPQRAAAVDISTGGLRFFSTRPISDRVVAVRLGLHEGAVETAINVSRLEPTGLYYETAGPFLARLNRPAAAPPEQPAESQQRQDLPV